MTVKEMEQLLDMPRANIRYYEQQGLLSPGRSENGYRDYTPEDVRALERVRLLRAVGCSVEEIREIRLGRRRLDETMAQKAEAFGEAVGKAGYARDLCEAIRREGARWETLDAKRYQSGQWRDSAPARPLPPPVESVTFEAWPWRRFFARTLDLWICSTAWNAFLALALRQNLGLRAASRGWSIVDTAIALLLMLLIEPILLRFFGTTPGKALFGIRVEAFDGGKLTVAQARSRTAGALWRGLGWNLPIYSLVRLWKSRKRMLEGESMPWEDESRLTVRDTRPWRGCAFVAACLCLLGATALCLNLAALPPHRGEITVVQFAENYNYLADYYQAGWRRLTDAGEWSDEQPRSEELLYLWGGQNDFAEISYTVEDGVLRGVALDAEYAEEDDGLINLSTLSAQAQMAALAYLGADLPALAPERQTLARQANLAEHWGSFDWSGSSGEMRFATRSTGYETPSGGMLFAVDPATARFSARLSLTGR